MTYTKTSFTKTTVTAAILAVSMSSHVHAAQETAPEFVKRISDNLVDRLVKDRKAYQKNPKVLYSIVQQNIEPHVDFTGFSRGVMGRYYRQASPTQRTKFQKTFRNSLLRAYSKYLGEYDNQSYSIRPFKAGKDPKKAIVTMDFKTSGQTVPISYQMIDTGKAWKIRNVKVAGIDIGLTFRKQFASSVEANRNNLDKAIVNFIPKAESK